MKEKKEPNPMQQLAEQLFGKIKDKSEAKEMLSELYKYGIEAMLKAELDEHLEHDKHEESPDGNYRNGSSKKTVKSSIGDLALNIPRDRNSTFSPIAVPKHERMAFTQFTHASTNGNPVCAFSHAAIHSGLTSFRMSSNP